MADVGIWIKNANIQSRCGLNASATAKAVAATDIYVLDVENFINSFMRIKVTAAVYAGLSADTKYFLMDIGANICAMYVINADMSGFTSRLEAQTMLDFLQYRISEGLKILKDKDFTEFMGLI